ncbi:hypothetical protein V5O48_018704 [Marasmius crinis-equi]|uniref:Non-specific serine/threonine protein kinase n=1 Tax=Marasmius crinis-equi TaxID=585013 RepID=A0ABR3EKE1_9AGAR
MVVEVQFDWNRNHQSKLFYVREVTTAAAARIKRDDIYGLAQMSNVDIRGLMMPYKLLSEDVLKDVQEGSDLEALTNVLQPADSTLLELSPLKTLYCMIVNVSRLKQKAKVVSKPAVRMTRFPEHPEHMGKRALEFLHESYRHSLGHKMMRDANNELIFTEDSYHACLGQEAPDGDPDVARVVVKKEEGEEVQIVTPAKSLRDEEITNESIARFVRQEDLIERQVFMKGNSRISSESTSPSPTTYGSHDSVATNAAHRAPSYLSQPHRHHAVQRTSTPINDGNNASGFPLAIGLDPKLYHPIFARFIQLYEEGCENMRQAIRKYGHCTTQHTTLADAVTRGLIWELSNALSKLGMDEAERLVAILPILRKLLGVSARKFSPLQLYNNYAPDIASLAEDLAPFIIAELKAHLGAGSSTLPRTQGLYGYISFLQAFRKASWNLNTCCPCFLVTLMGNQLEISGVVCPSRIHVTSLVTIELGYSSFPNDDFDVLWKGQIAFDALKQCRLELQTYYRKMQKRAPEYPFRPTLISIGDHDDIMRHAAPRLFPWPTSFLLPNAHGEERRVFFKYLWPLQMRATCSIFVVQIIPSVDGLKSREPAKRGVQASDDPHPEWDAKYRGKKCADGNWFAGSSLTVGGRVVVKFVRAYNDACHRYMQEEHELSPEEQAMLANASSSQEKRRFAPMLHGMADYECAGGFLAGYGKMVVMEYLDGWQTLHSSHFKDRARGDHLANQILLAVHKLNEKKYVHGDLRKANFMVEPVEKGSKVYIVDYDTAGQIDAQFPPMLPPRWDPTVKERMKMAKTDWTLTRAEDEEMIKTTLSRLGVHLDAENASDSESMS